MKRSLQIISLHVAIVVLAPGAWCFWTFAAWRARLQTKLDNLNTASLNSGSRGNT